MSSRRSLQSMPAGTFTGFCTATGRLAGPRRQAATSAGLRSDWSTHGTRVAATTALVATPMTAGVQRSRLSSSALPDRHLDHFVRHRGQTGGDCHRHHGDDPGLASRTLAEHQDDRPVPEVGAVGDLAEEHRGPAGEQPGRTRALGQGQPADASADATVAPTPRSRRPTGPAGRCPRRGCRPGRRRRSTGGSWRQAGVAVRSARRQRAGEQLVEPSVGAVVGAGGVDLGPVELGAQREP